MIAVRVKFSDRFLEAANTLIDEALPDQGKLQRALQALSALIGVVKKTQNEDLSNRTAEEMALIDEAIGQIRDGEVGLNFKSLKAIEDLLLLLEVRLATLMQSTEFPVQTEKEYLATMLANLSIILSDPGHSSASLVEMIVRDADDQLRRASGLQRERIKIAAFNDIMACYGLPA